MCSLQFSLVFVELFEAAVLVENVKSKDPACTATIIAVNWENFRLKYSHVNYGVFLSVLIGGNGTEWLLRRMMNSNRIAAV